MKKTILLIPLVSFFLTCVNNIGTGANSDSTGGTNDETVVRTGAVIYEQNGITPSDGAIVKVFRTDAIDGQYVSQQTTDSNGRFFIDNLGQGTYNIWVEKDSMFAFQDSVYISVTGTTLHNDTLDCASTLYGVAALQPLKDPRSVTIQVIGTDKCLSDIDSTGHFILKGMAGGTYSLFLKSDIPDYTPAIQHINLQNCTSDTLRDTIRLIDNKITSMINTQTVGLSDNVGENSTLRSPQTCSIIYSNFYDSLSLPLFFNQIIISPCFTFSFNRQSFP